MFFFVTVIVITHFFFIMINNCFNDHNKLIGPRVCLSASG